MNTITLKQAFQMMDIIAEKSCNLVGIAFKLGDYDNEIFAESAHEKTRETFGAICEILGIEKIVKD